MTKSLDQTHNFPQIPQIDKMFRQAFSNRSQSEGNVAQNIPRNNDDNNVNDSNKPPPLSTSSSEPIYTIYNGNLTKKDFSVHRTYVSCNNSEGNVIRNSFNDKTSDDYLRQGLCRFFRFLPYRES